jgi:hypothetical protein
MQKLKTKDVIGGPNPMQTFHATCANCKKIEQTIGSMQRCSKCNAAYYCNRDCQATHWKAAHKKVCKEAPSSTRVSAGFLHDDIGTLKQFDCYFPRES